MWFLLCRNWQKRYDHFILFTTPTFLVVTLEMLGLLIFKINLLSITKRYNFNLSKIFLHQCFPILIPIKKDLHNPTTQILQPLFIDSIKKKPSYQLYKYNLLIKQFAFLLTVSNINIYLHYSSLKKCFWCPISKWSLLDSLKRQPERVFNSAQLSIVQP